MLVVVLVLEFSSTTSQRSPFGVRGSPFTVPRSAFFFLVLPCHGD